MLLRSHSEQVELFARHLVVARTPAQLGDITASLASALYGVDAIVSFPTTEPRSGLRPITFPPFLWTQKYIVPFFRYPYLYLIRNTRIEQPVLAIDYSVSFDTNAATYVKTIVRARSLQPLREEVRQLFDELLSRDVNFDTSYYFAENAKIAYNPQDSRRPDLQRFTFWMALPRDFRWNIVALSLFKSVDCAHYRRTGTLKYTVPFIQAVREAVKFTHDFYAAPEDRPMITEFLLPLHKLLLLQLMAMLRIQFSSRVSPTRKFRQFLDFMDNKGEVFMQRETDLAYRYFKHRDSVPLLRKLNRGSPSQDLYQAVDNVAWDLTAARYLERMFALKLHGDFMVPFFMSFDRPLCDTMRLLSMKATVLDRSAGTALSLPDLNAEEYARDPAAKQLIQAYMSPERIKRRLSKAPLTLDQLDERIHEQYQGLLAVVRR